MFKVVPPVQILNIVYLIQMGNCYYQFSNHAVGLVIMEIKLNIPKLTLHRYIFYCFIIIIVVTIIIIYIIIVIIIYYYSTLFDSFS